MHTLVVGGTGMLAGVTRTLARQGHTVSVVSRGVGHSFVGDLTAGRINPIAVDYRESEALRQTIADAISSYGPIEVAVFWIHTDAPHAFRVIADEISRHARDPWRLFHVRGSAAHLHPETLEMPLDCLYRQVILGFILDGEASRWLTHDEISGGVMDAIQSDCERAVVGTLEPWEKRPR